MKTTTTLARIAPGIGAIVICAALLSSPRLAAQNAGTSDTTRPAVTLSGEVRHRFEIDGRFEADEDEPAFGDYHLLRSRAKLAFAPSNDIVGVVQVQDSRHFGEESGAAGRGTLDPVSPGFDMRQAFVLVSDFFGSGLDLQVGRQEMTYGNERLIGVSNWSNTGRSFDAIRLMLDREWGGVDLFASRLQGSLGNAYSQNFYGLYGEIEFGKNHRGDFYALLDNDTEPIPSGPDSGSAQLNRFTLGTFLRGSVSPIEYEAEFAYQGGEAGDRAGLRSVGAMLLSGTVAYRNGSVHVGGLYTLLSGDDNPQDDRREAFNTLFGTNHKFYGLIDYVPGAYIESGLQDFAVFTGMKFSDKTRLDLEGHLLLTAVDIGSENALGKELNAVVQHRYNAALAFNAGIALFLADPLMQSIIGRDIGWWGYVMTTVTL